MATRQREKAENREKTRDRRPYAIARRIRMSSGKVDIVLDLIRGKRYDVAVGILKNTNKSASPVILKVLNSAAANGENNLNMSKDTLFVAECWTGPGMTMKRMMPRARGRADRILKRTCHITVILDEQKTANPKVEVKKTVKPVATKAPAVKTPAETPMAKEPNAKKPLGTKPVATVKPVAKPSVKAPVKKEEGKK